MKCEIKDKELWDKNLLLAYKSLLRKVNNMESYSFQAFEKVLNFCKDSSYSKYEIENLANQIFPSPPNTVYSEFLHNQINELLKKNDVLNGLEGLLIKNGVINYEAFLKELEIAEKAFLDKGLSVDEIKGTIQTQYDTSPIHIKGNNVFYHGTSKNAYDSIKKDGCLIFQKYESNTQYSFLSQILEFDKNRLYLSDSFDDSIYYALRQNLDGYIIAVNMDGYDIYTSKISEHHFWTTEAIPEDRFINIYHIKVEGNRIIVRDKDGALL